MYVQFTSSVYAEWSMYPVPIIYHQEFLSKPFLLPTQQTTCRLPRKRSFPHELSTFKQHDIIRTIQD